MPFVEKRKQGLVFKITVQPKSSRNMVAGIYGDTLKIKLTAPPVNGAANKMCINFLAKSLKVSKSSLEIVAGHSSRTKKILLQNRSLKITPEKLAYILENL